MSFDFPSNDPLTDEKRFTFRTWLQWFNWVHLTVQAVRQSGTTASRPTNLLWIGRQYFDTDLGYPVWVQSVRPTVWVDAAGNPV